MTAKLPQGPRAPRTVQSYNWARRPTLLMETARERYGDVWTLRLLGPSTFILVEDPTLIEGIFTADPTLLRAGEANGMIGEGMLGHNSMLLLDGEPHAVKRKLLQPPFHHAHIDRYHDAIARICEEEIAGWPSHEPLELLPRMQAITLKSIMSVIFGVTGGPAQERLHARIRDIFTWAASPLHMLSLHVAHRRGSDLPKAFVQARDPLDVVLFEEIDRARQDPLLGERDDVLAMLLKTRYEDGSPMDDRDLRDQMVTLLIQGHQTTASALAWALERLMRHPDAYERLRAEAQSASEEYLDAVFKETLRVRPPLPIVPRAVAQRPYPLGEYELPVGSMVAPSIYMVQRREDAYPEPARFRPERFLEGADSGYTWIAFGGGDRHCIGRSFATAEFKLALRLIAQQVRLEPVDAADERIVRRGILFAPAAGARGIVRERLGAQAALAA
jgi:cytochrome P450 family 135